METLTGSLVPVTTYGGLLPLLLLPLAGAVINGLFGLRLQRRWGERPVQVVAIAAMVLASIVAVLAVLRLAQLPTEARFLLDRRWTLLAVERLHVDFALALDPLSAVMILVITCVGTLIHVYAAGYMAGDEGAWRFFAALNLFVFSMLLLVLGDSLVLCFFGWEGVGLCSYLLIGFWYGDRANASAARKAFVVNRVGDWGFLAGLLLLFTGLGGRYAPAGEGPSPDVVTVQARMAEREVRIGPTLSFRELGEQLSLEDGNGVALVRDRLEKSRLWGAPLLLLIGLAFFLGMSGKSAQIPLHVWLPDAMAGPTPVSALIHAATMVTAGIYLAARLAFLFALSPETMAVVALVGLLTALMGAVLAVVQHDIKKVLAYSTISQLGFMFLALGVGAHGAAIFHLITHACFKACLFLGAGALIHAVHGTLDAHEHGNRGDSRLAADPHDPQDLRNMGGLARALPRTRVAYLLGALAIAGFPVAAGFYSKDEILARVFTSTGLPIPARLFFVVALAIAELTSFYVFRSYYLAFFARSRDAIDPTTGVPPVQPQEAPGSMRWPLLILGGASVIVGPLLGWPEAWGGHPALAHWLDPVLAATRARLSFDDLRPSTEIALQLAGVLVALLGWAAARALYCDLSRTGPQLLAWRTRLDGLHAALWQRLHVDSLYREFLVHPVQDASRAAAWFDRRAVDGLVLVAARLVRTGASLGGWVDRKLVDGIVNALSELTLLAGRRLQRLQTGRINHYVLGIAIGAALLVVAAWAIK